MSNDFQHANSKINNFLQSQLHFAVKFRNISRAYKEIQGGADVDQIDIFGNTPLSLACIDAPNINIVQLLLRSNADINLKRPGQMDLFLDCIIHCKTELQTEIIRILIEAGINTHAIDDLTNRSCMHLIAISGYLPLAEMLLETNPTLYDGDIFNNTPADLAKIHENLEIVKLFRSYITASDLVR